MHGAWLVALCGLAGCPFVFEAPDLSNVDQFNGGDTAGDDDDDDDDDDTGDPTELPDFDLPDVVSLRGERFVDFIRFELQLADDDLDLVGGTLELTPSGGELLSLAIPEDIDVWQADGTSTVTLPAEFLDCVGGYDVTWTARVIDAGGHEGLPQATDVMVEAMGSFPESPYAHDIGYIANSAVACVTFNVTIGNPDPPLDQLRDDLEGVDFRVEETSVWTMEVAWPTQMDADLYIFVLDESSTYFAYETVASSLTYGSAWESLTLELTGDLLYQVSPAFWDPYGAEAPYTATVQWRPE